MKILVVGASGMLGHQMWKVLNEEFRNKVYGTVRKPKGYYKKFESLSTDFLIDSIDVENFKSIEKVLNDLKPSWIINCVGLTLRKPDLKDLEKCIEINSMFPKRLAMWSKVNGAKTIHFSTDCVFDGQGGAPYKETDLPTANDLYGKSKFLGEIDGESALTLRLSIIGRELESKSELVEWFLKQKGKTINGYANVIYSGLTTLKVAEEIVKIIKDFPHLSGLYQVSSEPISKFDLLHLLNDAFATQANIERFEEYSADKTLSSLKYSVTTGFVPPKWPEMIEQFAQVKSKDYDLEDA